MDRPIENAARAGGATNDQRPHSSTPRPEGNIEHCLAPLRDLAAANPFGVSLNKIQAALTKVADRMVETGAMEDPSANAAIRIGAANILSALEGANATTMDNAVRVALTKSAPKKKSKSKVVSIVRSPKSGWQARLTQSDRGGAKSTLPNATLILTHDTEWAGVLGYDSRAEQPVILSRPPFIDSAPALVNVPRLLTDGDEVRTAQWLEERHELTLPLPQIHAALNAVAEMTPFDRVREYLEAAEWDGTERLSRWPVTYLGAADTPYTQAVGRRWMISAVARTFEPGAKVDHVLVLEGAQGLGKSSALKVLAGDEYFGDDIPAIGSKDAQQYLGALWIVELGEMDAARKAEAATLKRFLTQTWDRYRPPYGRRMIVHHRRCVFAGSVNLDEYLVDSTGGRRFWPIKCTRIDLEALQRDRDQLWAEAVAAYKTNEPWHLDSSEIIDSAQREQARRLESDPWEDAVSGWLPRQDDFVTTSDVLTEAIEMHMDRIDKRASNRAAAIMRRLGWSYGEGRSRQRGWHRPTQPNEAQTCVGDLSGGLHV